MSEEEVRELRKVFRRYVDLNRLIVRQSDWIKPYDLMDETWRKLTGELNDAITKLEIKEGIRNE